MTRVFIDKESFRNHPEMVKALKEQGLEIVHDIPEAELIHEFDLVVLNPYRYLDTEISRSVGVNKSRIAGTGTFKPQYKKGKRNE